MSTILEPLAEFEHLIGRLASAAELETFARGAAAAGRELVVGGMVTDGVIDAVTDGVTDGHGRLFVQRRSLQRKHFPGCWDIVGGHAEAGEGVLAALGRELFEETGWRLAAPRQVVQVIDWRSGGEAKREIDLIVTAQGDLARPRLEPGRHTEGRWITAAETGLLAESRQPDDVYIKQIVERAFAILSGRWPRR